MTHEQATNRSRHWTWLAPIVVAAACAAAISLLFGRNHDQKPERAATAEAGRFAEMEQQLRRSNAALQRLEQAQLLRNVVAADDRIADDAGAVVEAAQVEGAEQLVDEHEPDDTQPAAYPEEREKAFFGAYFGELEEVMSHQRTDRQLAAQLLPLVPGADSGLVRVLDLSCTEQLCRLEARYEHADRATRDQFIRDLQSAFAPLMDRATIHLPTDDKRLLGYFAKKGATLPRPTTSFATFMRGDEG